VRKNVLVVDDDPHSLQLVNFFLEQAGFIVRNCKDGYSALADLNENHFDLLILDLGLPHMSGLKVLKVLRSGVHKTLPVLVLTSSIDKDNLMKAREFDVTDYMIKPPKKDDLLQRVERVLGGRPQFKEIKVPPDDPLAKGVFSVPVIIKSISKTGMVLDSSVQVSKGFVFNELEMALFKSLELKKASFQVTDCTPLPSDRFEYFVSFMGMSKIDQDKLSTWIMTNTYAQKKSG
jgi:DNA-binding response OmpR family regulator